MGKHYTAWEREEMERLRQGGQTYRAIGKQMDRSGEQIREYFRRKQKKAQTGTSLEPPKRKGRPRKDPLTQQCEYKLRIKELERENDLLRSFLHAAGRR